MLQDKRPTREQVRCNHIFERLRLDLRRCIECGLEQVRYVDPVEPLRWVNRCARCGAIRTDTIDSDICGSCADDLRAEKEAHSGQADADTGTD